MNKIKLALILLAVSITSFKLTYSMEDADVKRALEESAQESERATKRQRVYDGEMERQTEEALKASTEEFDRLLDKCPALSIWHRTFNFDEERETPLDQKILACDEQNKHTSFVKDAENDRNIKQFPALYQAYPGTGNYNYCGYYAVFNALQMLLSKNETELLSNTNNRESLNHLLNGYKETIRISRGLEIDGDLSNLSAEEIKSIITEHLREFVNTSNITVNGTDDEYALPEKMVEFKSSPNIEPQILIMNTSIYDGGSHWIVVLVKKVNNEVKMTIVDSLGLNRINTEYITSFYDQFKTPAAAPEAEVRPAIMRRQNAQSFCLVQ